jgi:hypothetical protein
LRFKLNQVASESHTPSASKFAKIVRKKPKLRLSRGADKQGTIQEGVELFT